MSHEQSLPARRGLIPHGPGAFVVVSVLVDILVVVDVPFAECVVVGFVDPVVAALLPVGPPQPGRSAAAAAGHGQRPVGGHLCRPQHRPRPRRHEPPPRLHLHPARGQHGLPRRVPVEVHLADGVPRVDSAHRGHRRREVQHLFLGTFSPFYTRPLSSREETSSSTSKRSLALEP